MEASDKRIEPIVKSTRSARCREPATLSAGCLCPDLEQMLEAGGCAPMPTSQVRKKRHAGGSSVPEDPVKVMVKGGWVALSGNVDWEYLRQTASTHVEVAITVALEQKATRLPGVAGHVELPAKLVKRRATR